MGRSETATQKNRRLEKARKKYKTKRSKETVEVRAVRLEKHRIENKRYYEKHREERKDKIRATNTQTRLQKHSLDQFENAINVFADRICEICTKRCYPKQVANFTLTDASPNYLPRELTNNKNSLLLCHRCKKHVTSKKPMPPAKAYWNNLDPGEIPEEIRELSEAETRLLARITPLIKIVKFSGIHGQYGFKGQAILFAWDIHEVVETLPCLLPRSTCNSDMVIVTEYLENIDLTRNYHLSRSKFTALQWLISNNPLYKDVSVDPNVQLDQQDFIRITSPPKNNMTQVNAEVNSEVSTYKSIGVHSKIIHASWHQGNSIIFNKANAGTQCCVMALVAVVRSSFENIQYWTSNILNENMITADNLYTQIKTLQKQRDDTNFDPRNGYMMIRDFDDIKDTLSLFQKKFKLNYSQEPEIFGSLCDKDNRDNEYGRKLIDGLTELFDSHTTGIIISNFKSYAVIKSDKKYYFVDSHSCGPKGSTTYGENGRACCIQCDNISELHRICKRATGSKSVDYTIDSIIVQEVESDSEPMDIDYDDCRSRPWLEGDIGKTDEPFTSELNMSIQTSMMGPIDSVQPDVEEELNISDRMNKIVRKTKDNIVNESHELKAEEYGWYQLFPYGKNGLKEQRPVKITPLDYYQFRILGNDLRFQRNDYLFYALSMFEYYRVKSNITACGKKIQGQEGMISDVHLYIKNLRGSSAYWNTALNELLAMIRCLGPPHFFITLSSNDPYWLDMRKALLIADGREDIDPESLSVQETQLLIEKYPVVVSRQFMIRIEAFLMLLKKNDDIFYGYKLQDFWWRIEFQNRGSPHLHKIVWLDNCPSFETPEGIELINATCSCKLPSEDEDVELRTLVKKCQTHHHTATCKKK